METLSINKLCNTESLLLSAYEYAKQITNVLLIMILHHFLWKVSTGFA